MHATALCPGPTRSEFFDAAGADGSAVPAFVFGSARSVARAGIAGLAAGRAVVVPGLTNQLGALGGHLTPRRLLLPLIGRFNPMLGH